MHLSLKIFITIFILISLIYLSSFLLGPGLGDFTRNIKNGYYYVEAGSYEKYIDYYGNEVSHRKGIDSRVDEYILIDNNIYVARTPRVVNLRDDVLISTLLAECEYWKINTLTHEIEEILKPKKVDINCTKSAN